MQLALRKLQMITNYDKLLCKLFCGSSSNQFQTQIAQAAGWRRWTSNNYVNKNNGKIANADQSRMVIISKKVFTADSLFILYCFLLYI